MNHLEMLQGAFARLASPQKDYWLKKLETLDTSWIEKLYFALTAKSSSFLSHLEKIERAHIKHTKQLLHEKVAEGIKQITNSK